MKKPAPAPAKTPATTGFSSGNAGYPDPKNITFNLSGKYLYDQLSTQMKNNKMYRYHKRGNDGISLKYEFGTARLNTNRDRYRSVGSF